MGILDMASKLKLNKYKESLVKKTGLEQFSDITNNIDLNNISKDDLKALTDPRYTQGLVWDSLNLNTMTSKVMNGLAPGSLDVSDLKQKLGFASLLKGRTTDLVNTQSGVMAVSSEVRINCDTDDVMRSKAISQGTNLQMANRAKQLRASAASSKSLPSNFVGKAVVA